MRDISVTIRFAARFGARYRSHNRAQAVPQASRRRRIGEDADAGGLRMNDSGRNDPEYIEAGEGAARRRLAVRARQGSTPGLFWLGGFHSDMKGTKAAALDDFAREQGRACVRFDYSGHGESGGAFAEGTIGRWYEDALAVYRRFCRGPQIVVGSSMGGWIALLLARELARQRREAPAPDAAAAPVAGLVLIAPAPDFTEELMWKSFSPEIRSQIETTGSWLRPSEYGEEPYPITRDLIEDGRRHLVLGGTIDVGCPVRILQGAQDPDVPWQHAFTLTAHLPADDVVLSLIQDGDHRLSRPQDIARMLAAVAELAAEGQSAVPAIHPASEDG
jgi:pimeloyl-ACP methyl ester carboxylesterase